MLPNQHYLNHSIILPYSHLNLAYLLKLTPPTLKQLSLFVHFISFPLIIVSHSTIIQVYTKTSLPIDTVTKHPPNHTKLVYHNPTLWPYRIHLCHLRLFPKRKIPNPLLLNG